MEEFPSNSRRPARARDEPKQIERVVSTGVVQRKTPATKRLTKHLFGDNPRSILEFVLEDVLRPAAKATIAEAVHGSTDRLVYGDSRGRGGSRGYVSSPGHTPYNRISSSGGRGRDDDRRDISRRARTRHDFGEIILKGRGEAEEVLDRLDDLAERYDAATVSDLYELVGVSSNYTDDKWGWTPQMLRSARPVRVREGFLLDLPKPEPID